jgi:tetratricopeptide (TPR) repeat protein
LERARQAYQRRDFASAVESFRQAREECPQPERLLLPLARAELMALRLEDSLRTLNEAAQQDPGNLDVVKLQGDVLYLLGRESEAETALQTVLRQDPRHQDARYALGRIYYQQKRLGEAIEAFQQLIQENPKHYRAHDNLAVCYAAQQKDSDALRHFLKALDLVHKDHREYDAAYANAAEFFLDRGEFEKAFQLAAEASERNPNAARNFFLTAKALARLERSDLAIRWLQQCADLDPNYQEAHYWLFQLYRKAGKSEEAQTALRKFKELSGKPRPAR